MADDDNDQYSSDEYQFSDLDAISPDSMEEEGAPAPSSSPKKQSGGTNIKRNALIALGVIILIMLAYKFLGSVFTSKTKPDSVPPLTTATPQPTQPQVQPIAPVQPTPTVQTPVTPIVQPSPDTTQTNQRISALELSQQNLRSEMDSLNNQLSGINSNVNELTAKIAQLNQMITILATKVEKQSSDIAILTVRTKPKQVKRIVIKRPSRPIYYIQAVIPGRAWLIAGNGSTITVREGTQIAGYGVVKLIDSKQGRVITSSGQIIRFSQQDS